MNINEILKSDYDLLCKDYKKATKKIEKQEQEIERLNNRIDKAIEYIENNNFYKTGMTEEGICYVVSCDKKELLDILKGSDKE